MRSAKLLGAAALVALLAEASAVHAFSFVSIADPISNLQDTYASGISGNIVVGNYRASDAIYIHGFAFNIATGVYTTVDDPTGHGYETKLTGVDGGIAVGWVAIPDPINSDVRTALSFVENLGTGTYQTIVDPASLSGAQNGGMIATGISGKNIVGYYENPVDKTTNGFFYNGTTYTTLVDPLATGSASDYTEAMGISGDTVVGLFYIASTNGNAYHGFSYNIATGTYTTLDSTLDPTDTRLRGISDGEIVGNYNFNNNAFLYDGDRYTKFTLTPGQTVFTNLTGIDGDAVVGDYSRGSGSYGFVASVPEPDAKLVIPLGVLVPLLFRRKTEYRDRML